MSSISIEQIKTTCELFGWKCLDNSYINLKTPMNFRCNEGHLVFLPWDKIREKFSCPVCANLTKQKKMAFAAKPKTEKYRIISLDQSSHKTGFAIYDDTELITYGVYEASGNNLLQRIQNICDWLDSMIYSWKPDRIGLEETLYNRNFSQGSVGTQNHDVFRILTQTMGAIMITVLRAHCDLDIVKIAVWRHYCGIKGRTRADQKRSAQLLVKKWHNADVSDDEADAICIGKYLADKNKNL